WSTTVTQQPFTAIESPTRTSSSTVRAVISSRAPPSRGSMARTRPSSSMIPVNMSAVPGLVLEAHVVAEGRRGQQAPAGGVGERARAGPGERGDGTRAEHLGRDVGHDPVDQPAVEECTVQGRTALDHGPEHVEAAEEIEGGGEVDPSRGGGDGLDLGACRPPG